MSLPRSSKDKSARINWGYHAGTRPLARTRRLLWVLAALFVAVPLLGATVLYALTGSGGKTFTAAASRGPLTNPHAAWDNQCEACHTPFDPVTGDRSSAKLLAALGVGPTHPPVSANFRCEQCHAGPPHSPLVKEESAAGCATCHRDHQGRDFSLVRLADSTCTRCHQDLPKFHLNPAQMAVAAKVSNFATDHPDFRTATVPPKRALKFSHAVHMAPGMGLGGSQAWSLNKITDPAARTRYAALTGTTDPNAALKLDCNACHTPDAKGAYYATVNFEANCKACHPLTFDESPGLKQRDVPHHLQPDGVDRFLREIYAARYLENAAKSATAPDRGTGRVDPRLDDLDPAAKAAALAQIETEVAKSKVNLFTGNRTCLECHNAEFPKPTAGVDPRIPAKIVPVSIPALWLTRGKFDHAAHRAVRCADCHPGSYLSHDAEKKAAAAPYQHPADIPGVANCRQCHAPARVENGLAVGGVRSACTDCHVYHHGSQTPKQPPSSVADFLLGRPAK